MDSFTIDFWQEGYDYRRTIKKMIPNLRILDDLPLTEDRIETPTNFESDWKFLAELEKEGTIGSMDSLEDVEQHGMFLVSTIEGKVESQLITRIAQMVKSPKLQSMGCRFESHCWWGCWYGPLAGLSLQIANGASEHHSINSADSNQVKITSRLLKIHSRWVMCY